MKKFLIFIAVLLIAGQGIAGDPDPKRLAAEKLLNLFNMNYQ